MRFHKAGTVLRDYFHYVNKATFAGVTGKTNGSFTVEISKDGANQATTGFVITEVSAGSNPGEYEIEVATTGFVSAVGTYGVRIRDTAAPEYTWEEVYVATSDGTGEGSIGDASFTAVASNGRVTDGAAALTGASVRIRSGSTIIAQFTTDSSGLWGPVYLANGTFTIDAQKSGYAANSARTIVVTSGTAVGPLVDVAIAAATSSSGLTASDLWSYARRMVRNANGTQADTEIKQAVNDALDMIAQERLWPYFKTHGELALADDYSTGTVACTQASANVTLTTGTWPANAASCKIRIGGKVYRVSSRTSNSVIVLTTAWTAASVTAETFALFQDEYTLPSDLMKVGALLPGTGWGLKPDPVGLDQILEAQNSTNSGMKYPTLWAVLGHGAISKIILYPHPNEATQLALWYYRKPAALVNSLDEADWDAQHVQLLRRAIDYQIALRYPDVCVAGNPDATYSRYSMALMRALPNDKSATSRPSPISGYRMGRDYTITG